jgi:hypothetical protein
MWLVIIRFFRATFQKRHIGLYVSCSISEGTFVHVTHVKLLVYILYHIIFRGARLSILVYIVKHLYQRWFTKANVYCIYQFFLRCTSWHSLIFEAQIQNVSVDALQVEYNLCLTFLSTTRWF